MDRGSSRMITLHGSVVGMFIFTLHVVMTVVGGHAINVTILESAISKGAVCLDGSAPAYFYDKGSGNGSQSWMIYLEGGGWCYSLDKCVEKSHKTLGSGRQFPLTGRDAVYKTSFSGLLDSSCTSNPDFCNWNKVFVHYCDGSSYMSNVTDSKANLTFRGARIFNAMMEEFLSKGMINAKDALLSGGSAGGLATMLHCDGFRSLFPSATRVKCISDSGFFIRGEGHHRDKERVQFYENVINTHELANSLPKTCTSKMNSNLCLFPENFVRDIETPLFIIESSFDSYQVTYNFVGKANCTENLTSCSSTELDIIRDFGLTLRKTLESVVSNTNSSSRGLFVHSYYKHGHIHDATAWTCLSLAKKTMRQSVGDWYFDRSYAREIDHRNDSLGVPPYVSVCTSPHDSVCPLPLN